MKEIDGQNLFGFVRMSPNQFDHLWELLKPIILKKNAVRALIPPDERLAIALRFLASGESRASLNYCFKIEITTLCGIIEEVCAAIWKHTLKAVPTNQNYLSHLVHPSLASKQLSIYLYFSCEMLI